MDYKAIFATRLKELRLAKGLDQPKFAALVGLAKQTINGMEKGRCTTTLENLCTIADALEVSLDYLCGRSDTRERMP